MMKKVEEKEPLEILAMLAHMLHACLPPEHARPVPVRYLP